ncbi:MAG: hypothetical protein QXG86_01465 [Candidatus Woesearchaeota archaeon]
MAILNLLFFLIFLFISVKSADYATYYSSKLAKIFRLSEFIVSFFIVAIISALPEGTIAIISAIKGVPELGLGTLFGSNVADLALVFGVIAITSSHNISIRSQILSKDFFYLILLLFPVLLSLDGQLSRIEGLLLIAAGIFFFMTLSVESHMFRKKFNNLKEKPFFTDIILLIISLAVMIFGAHYTIKEAVIFAEELHIPPILIGLTVISIGTCLPELMFSLRAIKKNKDQLALGDILGTVITDATIIVGIITIIHPFIFNQVIAYVTGTAMFIAGLLAVMFIKSGKVLTKKEGFLLLSFYFLYLIVEVVFNKIVQ